MSPLVYTCSRPSRSRVPDSVSDSGKTMWSTQSTNLVDVWLIIFSDIVLAKPWWARKELTLLETHLSRSGWSPQSNLSKELAPVSPSLPGMLSLPFKPSLSFKTVCVDERRKCSAACRLSVSKGRVHSSRTFLRKHIKGRSLG